MENFVQKPRRQVLPVVGVRSRHGNKNAIKTRILCRAGTTKWRDKSFYFPTYVWKQITALKLKTSAQMMPKKLLQCVYYLVSFLKVECLELAMNIQQFFFG